MTSYWERLYSAGGNSGSGSVGTLRDWKWKVLQESGANLESVIDVGCGDLSFWEGRTCGDYLGIEQSRTRCDGNLESRPDLPCICSDAAETLYLGKTVPTVLCFDVLFHIMDPHDYISILRNLSRYSSDYVFVYTWHRNPFMDTSSFLLAVTTQMRRGNFRNARALFDTKEPVTDFQFQYYRNFSSYMKYLDNHICTDIITPPSGIDRYGAMYIFRRKA